MLAWVTCAGAPLSVVVQFLLLRSHDPWLHIKALHERVYFTLTGLLAYACIIAAGALANGPREAELGAVGCTVWFFALQIAWACFMKLHALGRLSAASVRMPLYMAVLPMLGLVGFGLLTSEAAFWLYLVALCHVAINDALLYGHLATTAKRAGPT